MLWVMLMDAVVVGWGGSVYGHSPRAHQLAFSHLSPAQPRQPSSAAPHPPREPATAPGPCRSQTRWQHTLHHPHVGSPLAGSADGRARA